MTAKQESELLMNDLLPFAKRMLGEFGEFHPFGGVLALNGAITHVGATTGQDSGPPSELVELLERAFQEQATQSTIRAAAIVLNVSIIPPGSASKVDAIEVRVDHVMGFSANVFFPYIVTEGHVTTSKPFATRGEAFAFQAPARE